MFALSALLSALCFAFLVPALVPPPAPPGTDACGPFNHFNDAGFNTCQSAVTPGGPAPYGITCATDSAISNKTIIKWEACAMAAKGMCFSMVQGRFTPGEWHWTSDQGGPECRVGLYIHTDPSGAPQPNYRRCLNQIYQPMVRSCMVPGSRYNVGTVNIARVPDATIGDPGARVNDAYNAYIVSPMALYPSSQPPATANVWGDPNSAGQQATP
ncbi:MAG: hypothetical protein L6R40_006278 [Gallowayella cf. fulva]|nr:MAG: hypothetical protein L6R40_006278 [Xanthomendoza cf. fulva]